ncbi:hypothetical protein ACNHKD_05400 [Methylocystis sp. JAN1]|uniref:Cap15 family cyclic dinucleotide receptor domain-containing protein n=1 Tax=Methylocystis sp. JAN1 TaxID=3397211 RepID=UPI003FA2FAB7
MLHLLPIRILTVAFAAAVGLLILAAFDVGQLDAGQTLISAQLVVRWASSLSLGAFVLLYAGWRWLPMIQAAIFPYLGGRWEGNVRFGENQNLRSKPVTMEAKHTLFGIKFLLDSDESSSSTLAVHAEKDPDFDRYRLFYVYLNRRKEGVIGGGQLYTGLAVVRWVDGSQPALEGDYFTETHRRGTLHLRRVEKTQFWKLWR